MKNLFLALDSGSANTDAELFGSVKSVVSSSAKAFTAHHDRPNGLVNALWHLLERHPLKPLFDLLLSVNFSATLAANAIAEGQNHQVWL
ncbi:MAG: hypothetical protein LBT47_08450 [Deltaproteobacteria bacterium]|jgi:N-methylhydantoinase A/oxoprolinase/acetone carboxylase beta subunit|nr:hypothetical protein [Deltaproteobacteria bacterium]